MPASEKIVIMDIPNKNLFFFVSKRISEKSLFNFLTNLFFLIEFVMITVHKAKFALYYIV